MGENTAGELSARPPVSSLGGDWAEYLVVLRARSSARFLPEAGVELKFDPLPGLTGEMRLRVFSRWVASGLAESLPRELVFEVRGRARSLEDAVHLFPTPARPMATVAAFAANVRVGLVEVHLAYDCTPDHEERELIEAFLPDEIGNMSEGRFIRPELMIAAAEAFLAAGDRAPRLGRALRQYELALRDWYVGGEWLALSHLYMAVEALTDIALDRTLEQRGTTDVALAKSVGIVTDDPQRPRWKDLLKSWCRREVIFAGDRETFRAARTASDGLEHGFLDLREVHAHALRAADQTFAYVRRTITDLLDLPDETAGELMAIRPMDVQSRRKIIHGRLTGKAEDPAPVGELYPLLEWTSGINSVIRDGSALTVNEQESLTVRTREGIGFQPDGIEIVGRLENGQVPVTLDEEIQVTVTSGNPSRALALLASVMPLVEAAARSGQETGQEFPRMLVFNLFGQGTAFFQGAQMLIEGHQPVEALLPLRGLAVIQRLKGQHLRLSRVAGVRG